MSARPSDERLAELARRAARRPALAPERERALVERILAATTREDLSRRGDLRLLGACVRARLRESPALRLLCWSLAAHALLVAAVVWALVR